MTSVQPPPAAAANDGPAAMNLAVEAALSNLKPLRDLAQNWDIDIASCLEDYLHELVYLGHPPDPRFPNGQPGDGTGNGPGTGSSDTNFAQAALLLQNSSSVYSRKVEYLHSLVYQALNDLIASTRNGGKNGSRQGASKRGGTDAILEELTDFDADMEFLLLDDVLPTDDSPDGDRINLRDDDGNVDILDYDDDDEGGIHNNNLSLLLAAGTPKTSAGLNATRLSLGGLSVTRLDRSAMGNNRGVTSEAATRALIGTILNEGSDGQGNLRLLSGKCDVSSTGALLMPGSSLLNAGGSGNNNGQGRDSSMMVNPDSSLFMPESAGTDAAAMEEDEGHFAPAGDDDDDDGGMGFALADDYDGGGEKHTDEDMTAMQAPKRVQFAPIPAKKADPWALLDPHDAGTAKARPLRIGVTYRLPPGLDDTPSECVTGARTKTRTRPRSTNRKMKKRTVEGLDSFVSVAAYKSSRASVALDEGDMDDEEAEKLEALAEVNSVSMTGLAYGSEFAYIAKSTAKREAAAKREERRKKQMEEAGLRPSSSSGHDQQAAAAFDDDEDDYGSGFDFGGDDDDMDENDEGQTRGNVGVTSLDEAISTATTSGAHFGSGDDSTNLEAETFEELCRAHLRAFARGAEKYAAETQLSRRVGDWQGRLSPILEEEEQRPEFDIHVYGDRIMQTVQDEIDCKKAATAQLKLSAKGPSSPTNVVDFRAVTKDSEDYEVCRLFLSALMLCNSGNVILSHEHDGAAVASPESLRIELVEGQVERPMETYLAPSVVQQENMIVS